MKSISPFLVLVASVVAAAGAAERNDFRVLATSKTSTMEKEMNQAAEEGYVFSATMGGDTATAGSEVVTVMTKNAASGGKRTYKLLATSKTSTMQKEMDQLGAEGYEYRGQTVFASTFGGREVVVIMEKDASKSGVSFQYRLLATTKTSTMQKELKESGEAGFALVGLTVSRTAFGGAELVSILRKQN